MSEFSGQFDLADHIFMEKMYDRGSYYDSDELECFEFFKQKTGGKIYQFRKITPSRENKDYIKDLCNYFDYTEHKQEKTDKRRKSGKRTETFYTYKYYGKEYTEKEIKNVDIHIEIPIPFETILDIIPYYPYTCIRISSDQDQEHIVIGDLPSEQEYFLQELEAGFIPRFPSFFNSRLQRHYVEVCQKYILKDLDQRTMCIEIKDLQEYDDYTFKLSVTEPIDYMHPLEFVWKDGKGHPHWTSPTLLDVHTIGVSKLDVNQFLKEDIEKGEVVIKYVRKLPEVPHAN